MGAVTVFVATQGGTVLEMDVPVEGSMAHATWLERLDKRELVIIPAAHWVDRGDGTSYLVADQADQAAEPADASEPPTSKWTKAQLVDWLTSADVEHDPKATNATLAALVDGAREWFAAAADEADQAAGPAG